MKTNKILFLILFVFLNLNLLKSQNYSYGVRAGMLYNFGGKLEEIKQDAKNILKDKGNAKSAWQIGGFARIKIPFLFIQPEFIYSQFSRTYCILENVNFNSKIHRLDFSPLIGTSFLGFFRIYGAPVFSLNFNSKLDLKNSLNPKVDRWGYGFQLGLGADISIITVDLRWENGLSKFENNFKFDNKNYLIKNKLSALIFSLGLKF